MAYGWSARKVMIGLSLFVNRNYKLVEPDIKFLLDQLKDRHIKISNYQLEGVVPVNKNSVEGIKVEKGASSLGTFHLNQYTAGKEGKASFVYSGDSKLNNIFSESYAPEIEGYREVYLFPSGVKYIEPTVPKLDNITPKPISKKIRIRFKNKGKVVPSLSLEDIKVNNRAHPSEVTEYEINENSGTFKVEVKDKKYKLEKFFSKIC